MEKNSVHNNVRQVLMNELGLTRETVRGMMEDIVNATVAKHMANLETRGVIQNIVRREIEQLANKGSPSFGRSSIQTMIADEAKRQIEAFIKARVRIDTETPSP